MCYINIKNNRNKTKIENKQRDKIISLFRNKYQTYINDESNIEIGLQSNNTISLPQVPAWIMGLLYSIDSDITEVRMGYCMNDDAASYVEDIKKIWKAYQSISEHKLPKLTFPLLKRRKIQSKKNYQMIFFKKHFFVKIPVYLKC